MNDTIAFLIAVNAGLVLGALFFGGLWWTTGKAVTSQHVALWIISSLLLRIGIVITGFYFVAGSHWERFAGCLLGFITARVIVIALTKRLRQRYGFNPSQANRSERHAPELTSDEAAPTLNTSLEKN